MTLSVGELREHVQTDLGDEALQRLLDAAYAAIESRIGAAGSRVELVNGGYRTIALGRQTDSVSAVTETIGTTTTTLSTDDYRLRPDGYTLERLSTGTNPRWRWLGLVEVMSVSSNDDALRDSVAIDLCRLALTYNPGLTSQTIGTWTEQYGSNSVWNNAEERDSILARLNPSPGMVVVGPSWVTW